MSGEVAVMGPHCFSIYCTTVLWKFDLSGASDLGCMFDDSGEIFLAFFSVKVVPGCNVKCED